MPVHCGIPRTAPRLALFAPDVAGRFILNAVAAQLYGVVDERLDPALELRLGPALDAKLQVLLEPKIEAAVEADIKGLVDGRLGPEVDRNLPRVVKEKAEEFLTQLLRKGIG